MNTTIRLYSAQQAYQAITDIWSQIKCGLISGCRYEISVRQERRSVDQNAKFHALCSDLSKSGLEFAGARRSLEDWKTILVSGHAVATKEGCEIVTGIEGELVNLRESTAKMSKARSSSLIEYATAFAAQHGIE